MSTATATRYRRSPFLVVLWQGNQALLLNAETQHRRPIHPNLVGFLSRLGDWRTADELATPDHPVTDEDLERLRELGLLEAEDDAARRAATFEWDPIELTIQRRTATGGLTFEVGSSAPPSTPPRFADSPVLPLPPPKGTDAMSWSDVLQRRRSIRSYASRPLRLDELSALLYHSARVIAVRRDPQLGERALRPFPTAGARSELELYVIAFDVAGLSPAAHYYDAAVHGLVKVRNCDEHQQRILRFANAATGNQLTRPPAVVLLITAAFERVMWKYRDLGLTLVYKDVGALMQTLYFVATALRLAPCAIGAGEEAENSRWLGLDPLRESQVGCFLVGPALAPEEIQS